MSVDIGKSLELQPVACSVVSGHYDTVVDGVVIC